MTRSRRMFLRGLGASLAIPFLPSIAPRAAWAQDERPTFFVVCRQANGMIQGARTWTNTPDPDRYFPTQTGALSAARMAEETDRATGELAEYRDRLLLLKNIRGAGGTINGVDFGADGHGYGGVTLLTARPPGNRGATDKDVYASGESLDMRIAREMNAGSSTVPLTLYAGESSGYIQENISFARDGRWTAAEHTPRNAFMRLAGLVGEGGESGDDAFNRLQRQRRSVNDLVLAQLREVRGRAALSASDRRRLDGHMESVRYLEEAIQCELPDLDFNAGGSVTDGDVVIRVANLHAELIALAFACDLNRSATLQISSGTGGTFFNIPGRERVKWHHISHRVHSDDGSNNTPVNDAVGLHAAVDRIHLRDIFKPLLDRLRDRGVLDDTIAVHTSEISVGLTHRRDQLGMVVAGGGGGKIRTGQFIDTAGAPIHHILNSFGAACGVKNEDGDPLDNFGHDALERGHYAPIMA